MLEPLCRRLDHFVPLCTEEFTLLAEAVNPCVRMVPARRDLFTEGETASKLHFILSGWMERYSIIEDGRRQITELLLPGDICGREALTGRRMASHYGTISVTRLAEIEPDRFLQLLQASGRLLTAFVGLLNASDLAARSWIVSLGQRTALERFSHFICEIHDRLSLTGEVRDRSFEFPLRQSDLAALLGMSTVHVNRTFQEIRERGLIAQQARRMTILKPDILRKISLYGERAALASDSENHHGPDQTAAGPRHTGLGSAMRHAPE